jgi:tetratricopeptide (TPR) repeat protein
MAKKPARFRFPEIAGVVLLFAAVLAAYSPAIDGSMVWDDDAHVTRPDMQSLYGLGRIWFRLGATQQYYPLLHSAFWVEHKLWGDAAAGYHLVNLLLHALASLLVVRIVRRLELPGAWLAGFLFALHPVSVEAVAWISEQKSTLSTVFYLAAALVYLRFDRTRRRAHYLLALCLFLMALLSKTVTATLPEALLVILWWQRKRLSFRRDVVPLLPWLAIGASAGLFTAWVERTYVAAEGPDFALTLVERCLIAGRAFWFYLAKLAWPVDLTFIYPRWTVDGAVWWQYLFPLGALALGAALWVWARRSRGPLAAFLFFAGTLFPVLGFFNVYPFLFSFVADHFQYLASAGIFVLAASGLSLAASRIPLAHRKAAPAACVLLLAVLGALTWRQSAMYQDAETLYRETLWRNRSCWMAHNNLGVTLVKLRGRTAEAATEFEAALRLRPNYEEAHNNLGNLLAAIPGRLPEAVSHFQAALRTQPGRAEIHNSLGNALAKMPGRLNDAVAEYETALRLKPFLVEAHTNLGLALAQMPGRVPEAIAELQTAVRMRPDSAQIHNNLGSVLAKIPGRSQEEVAEYEAALGIDPNLVDAHYNLGLVLSQMPGRGPEAIRHFEAVVAIDPDHVGAQYSLGLLLVKVPGRLPEATEHLEAVVRLRPDLEVVRQMVERLRAAQK